MIEKLKIESIPNDPRAEILAIQNQINQMGANDHEHQAINLIMKNLQRGKITAEEALRLAHSVLDNKQDYH